VFFLYLSLRGGVLSLFFFVRGLLVGRELRNVYGEFSFSSFLLS